MRSFFREYAYESPFCSKKHYSFYSYYKNKGLTDNTIRSIFKDKNK